MTSKELRDGRTDDRHDDQLRIVVRRQFVRNAFGEVIGRLRLRRYFEAELPASIFIPRGPTLREVLQCLGDSDDDVDLPSLDGMDSDTEGGSAATTWASAPKLPREHSPL